MCKIKEEEKTKHAIINYFKHNHKHMYHGTLDDTLHDILDDTLSETQNGTLVRLAQQLVHPRVQGPGFNSPTSSSVIRGRGFEPHPPLNLVRNVLRRHVFWSL